MGITFQQYEERHNFTRMVNEVGASTIKSQLSQLTTLVKTLIVESLQCV